MRARTNSRSTQVPAKIGRPTKYSDEWARQFCDLISQGKSVVDVCAMEGQPSRDSVYTWMREREDFSDMYARAREERADLLFERIAAIAEDATGDYVKKEDGTWVVDHENIQRSRLRVDTMKWMASKLAPRKYGDRVEHDVKGGDFQPAILIQIGDGAPEEPVEVSGKVIEAE